MDHEPWSHLRAKLDDRDEPDDAVVGLVEALTDLRRVLSEARRCPDTGCAFALLRPPVIGLSVTVTEAEFDPAIKAVVGIGPDLELGSLPSSPTRRAVVAGFALVKEIDYRCRRADGMAGLEPFFAELDGLTVEALESCAVTRPAQNRGSK